MRVSSSALALVLAAAAVASARGAAVFELTPDTFDETVKGGAWVVEFYAPWCGHCQKLAPHYEAAAKEVALKNPPPARFAKVDGAAHRSLMMRFGVTGYPTIFHIDASGAVRPASVPHSKQALVALATRTWNSTAPLALAANPNGPIKYALFLFIKYGEKAAGLHEPVAARLGVPPLIVLFTFGLFGVVFLAGFCIVAAVWIGPTEAERRKRD